MPHTLLIPAIDLDRAERVVFGRSELRDVPVSQAIAASSAALRFGYASTREWLDTHGHPLLQRFVPVPQAA